MTKNFADSRCRRRFVGSAMTLGRHRFDALRGLGVVMVLGLVTSCADDTHEEAAQSWTERPTPPADMNAFFAPDDEPDECALSGPPPANSGDVPVFLDAFDGDTVDAEKWNVANTFVGFAGSINTSAPGQAKVRDGSLLLTADRNPTDTKHPFVSAALDSRGTFARTYGKVELRARFPKAPGVWYSLIGRPWADTYPIVKVELINRSSSGSSDKTQLYFGNEWAGAEVPDAERRMSSLVEGIDFSELHTFTIDWRPDSIEWRIDGVTKMTSKGAGVGHTPMYWTMGAWVGGWPGRPSESVALPVSFEIADFSISRVDGVVGEPGVVVRSPKSTYFRDESIGVQLANFDEACAHVDVYEGAWRVARRSKPPYRLPLEKISHGKHDFTFVATDGVRTAKSSLSIQVN